MEILFLIAGLPIFSIGLYLVADHIRYVNKALETQGRIIGFKTSKGSKDTIFYRPVVRCYIGSVNEFTSTYGSAKPQYQIGDTVPVLYVEGKEPRIKSMLPYIMGFVLMVMGGISTAVYISMFRFTFWYIGASVLILVLLALAARKKMKSHGIDSIDELKDKIKSHDPENNEKRDHIISNPEEIKRIGIRQQKTLKIVGPVFLLFGIGATVGAIYLGVQRYDFLEKSVSAYGTVVDMHISRSNDGSSYYPVVEFSPSGSFEVFTFRHDVGSNPPSYRRGEQVDVLYLPDNPEDAIIDAGLFNWAAPVFVILFGIVFTAAGFSIIKKGFKNK